MKKIVKLIIAVIICQSAGLIGSFFTRPSINSWYKILAKPSFTPPSWVFAPVWVTLYATMGISAFLVWDKGLDKPEARKALGLFLFQLIINVGWSMAFFGMRNILLSIVVITILWISIFWTIMKFYKISKSASFILIPYLCWVSFAVILNVSIFLLNS